MNIYQEHLLDHYRKPHHYGPMPNADLEGVQHNPLCGDKLSLYIRNDSGLARYSFEGEGCAVSMAAASILGDMIDGQPWQYLTKVTDEMMLQEVGVPLSPARVKCGLLALSCLRSLYK